MTENNAAPRYAPPNQRSRSLSRRKSGDHGNSRSHNNNNSSSSSSPSFEGERERDNNRHHSSTTTTTSMSRSSSNDNIITIEGCSRSKAAQLLSTRWSAAIQAYNDPSLHPSEKPVMYTGGGTSAWGSPRLTHQMDFLTELRRAILDAKANPDA